MRFDWCKANLHTACEEHKYDHCEMCNIARSYQHGYETGQEDMPKTGEWILTPMLSDNYRYECSNCMSHHRARYDYCPSCGSRMFREDGEA